jgi:hypothetical protein
MSSLELQIVNRTNNGAVHLQVKSANDEFGVLYLSKEQYETLIQIIRVGCFNKEVDLTVNDPYNVDEGDDEDNSHIFYSID